MANMIARYSDSSSAIYFKMPRLLTMTSPTIDSIKIAHNAYALQEGILSIGGRKITEIKSSLGQTPLFIYDRGKIINRIEQLRQALPQGLQIYYAVKANPFAEILSLLSECVDGVDVASQGEMQVALNAGFHAQQISFAGPGKTLCELEAAVQAGVLISLESAREFQRVLTIGKSLGRIPHISVRINPAFELRSSGMRMAGRATPFGVEEEQVPALLKTIAQTEVDLLGFHVYAGSQCLTAQHIIDTQSATLELMAKFADSLKSPPSLFNIGGGFGIPYFAQDTPLEITPIGENLNQWQSRIQAHFPDTQIVMELGRYLVGEAGIYLFEVIDRKQSQGETFVITNGGMHHHLAASGNFGQVIRRNYPLAVANRMNELPTEKVHVVGPLCTPLDILARDVSLPRTEPGDLIAVFQSGAYALNASPQQFLLHPAPSEVLV